MNELIRSKQILGGIRQLRKRVDVFAARVHPLYVLLGWTWHDTLTPPTGADIGASLHGKLDYFEERVRTGELEAEVSWCISSGGLEAGFDHESFFLSFQLDDVLDIELDPVKEASDDL